MLTHCKVIRFKLVLIHKIRTTHWKHPSELPHQGEELQQDLGRQQPQEEVELQRVELLQEGLQQERQLLELRH